MNPIEKNISRVNKKDIEIAQDLIEEHDVDFENISLDEINEIEDILESNIYIFGCNKKFESKKIIRKSIKNYDKDLDLLLIDQIEHYIMIKNINIFDGGTSHIAKSCRNCLNSFYSESKYNFHLVYCKNRRPQNLMSSYKKYMVFENLKNCIKSNWLIHSDFECVIDPITKEHTFIAGCIFLQCKNEKYTKNNKSFFDLQEYTKYLYDQLKYIEEVEEKFLNNTIDYTNFDQEIFDNTLKCKYCECEFNNGYNDRFIILNEIVDKQKLEYILNNNDFLPRS